MRSLWSFLAIPLLVVACFLILAVVTYRVDQTLTDTFVKHNGMLEFLSNLFGDRQSTRSLLSTIASALITVTSITFSLLLVAVQQAAGSFSNQIFEQFRNRRSNQLYFGFFVGLSLYTLVTLATTRNLHHPLFGALISIVLTVVALLLILVLIYTTIEQMRSSNVVSAIATTIRDARQHEESMLSKTRRIPNPGLPMRFSSVAERSGTVNSIDLDGLSDALENCAPEAELILRVGIGMFIGRADPIADIGSRSKIAPDAQERIDQSIKQCVGIGGRPRISHDPQVGIRQLSTISWNSTSTAISNPNPPILICHTIRDLVWEWADKSPPPDAGSRIVYPDFATGEALALLESTAVASGESKQPQTLAEVYSTYAALLPKLEPRFQAQVEEAIRLSLGALPGHFPTQQLNRSMERLAKVLEDRQSPVAAKLRRALTAENQCSSFEAEPVWKQQQD